MVAGARVGGVSSVARTPMPFVRAEIIAVGSELLTPLRSDTNSLFLTGRLNELGVDVRTKTIVGDNLDDLSRVFRQALDRADLLILCGGLGPTDDDLTREAVATVLDLPLEVDERIIEGIRKRFESRGLSMPDINRRQGMVPRGAVAFENAQGTAPGLWIEHEGKTVVLLPGPPRELNPMFERVVRDRLAPRAGSHPLRRRVLRVTGRTESHVEEQAQPVYARWQTAEPPINTTILAAPGQVELHLSTRATSDQAAEAILDRATEELATVLGRDLYSTDGRTLEQVVGDQLRGRGYRIAESCTGGLIASRLTDIPGSSEYVDLAIVAYSNRAKVELLGVSDAVIQQHGAVSEPVVLAMATGARARGKTDIGVGVTGLAGPGGGTERKPIGTVWMAASGIEGIRTALDRAHRLRGRRPYWLRRTQSLGLVIVFSVVVIAAETGLVLGPLLWQMFGNFVPGGEPATWPAGTVQLILGTTVAFVVTCALYRFLPARAPTWRGIWPGALLALVLWSITLAGFSVYAANVDTYQTIYGGLGGIVLSLVLFYMLAAIFIFCSEVNAAIIEGASRSEPST